MSKNNALNPNRPASTGESPRLGDNVIRTLAAAVAELLNIDHYVGSDSGSGYTEDAAGEHKKIKFNAPMTTPTNVTNKGFLYTKDVSGVVELHFLDEAGNEIQLTTGGILNSCNLTGSQTVAGVKTFSSFPVTPSSAPTTDYHAANKKYVDDQVDTQNMTPAAYAGGQSVTFANGLIIKGGYTAIGATSGTVTYGTAFPTAVLSITLTMVEGGAATTDSVTLNAVSNLGDFNWRCPNSARDGFYWLAVGY